MKILFILLVLTTSAFAKDVKSKKELPKDMSPEARKLIEDVPEEDCEEKAKKPVVIPEEPVLGLGDAGCSIDDM